MARSLGNFKMTPQPLQYGQYIVTLKHYIIILAVNRYTLGSDGSLYGIVLDWFNHAVLTLGAFKNTSGPHLIKMLGYDGEGVFFCNTTYNSVCSFRRCTLYFWAGWCTSQSTYHQPKVGCDSEVLHVEISSMYLSNLYCTSHNK